MSVQFQQAVSVLSGLGDDAFVHKAYATLLGRPADPTGFRDYLARLRAGIQRVQIWSELAGSEEANRFAMRQVPRSVPPASASAQAKAAAPTTLAQLLKLEGADFVRQAYWVVLGREADPTGLRDRVQQLEAGGAKSQVLADLHCDPEGQAFGAKLSGLDDWVKLVQQQASVSDLLMLHGDLFVMGAYVALFKREPDPDGFARYMALLRSGASRSFILMELFKSPEAREKSSNVRGLVSAIDLYCKAQRKSWGGWYRRNVLGVESDLPAARERRALAYMLATPAAV